MKNRFTGIGVDEIGREIERLKEMPADENNRRIFGMLDLTSLNVTDSERSILSLVEKVNGFEYSFPALPSVAAICVYPRFVPLVRKALSSSGVRIAAVGASFPTSLSFNSVRLDECRMAIEEGADEIDMVMLAGELLSGEDNLVRDDIASVREAVGNHHLKVILETGVLKDPETIYHASMLALDAGADFIKTSTGKVPVSATPEAAWVMCRALNDYYAETGRMAGFKPAGGISTPDEAALYYNIVSEAAGRQWLNPETFRIGASRLANNLLSDIEGRKVNYFQTAIVSKDRI